MTDTPLILGPVAFAGFEIPAGVRYGGRQRLAVHELANGTRIVDAMGRADAPIVWSGAFSGPDAALRARLVDELRVAGLPLSLTWDAYFYTVAIASFDADYANAWWIPYRIVCTVIADEASALIGAAVSLLGDVVGDLASAAAYTDVGTASDAVQASGATTLGTGAYQNALGAVQASGAAIDGGIGSAGSALDAAGDLPSATSAAGNLAQLGAARGYVLRAGANLANAGT